MGRGGGSKDQIWGSIFYWKQDKWEEDKGYSGFFTSPQSGHCARWKELPRGCLALQPMTWRWTLRVRVAVWVESGTCPGARQEHSTLLSPTQFCMVQSLSLLSLQYISFNLPDINHRLHPGQGSGEQGNEVSGLKETIMALELTQHKAYLNF